MEWRFKKVLKLIIFLLYCRLVCKKSDMTRDKNKVVITSSRFGGTDALTPNDIKRLVVNSYSEGPRLIEGFIDQPILMVGLEFTADNTAVDSANAIVAGKIEQVEIDANKIWPFQRQINLNLLPTDLSLLQFRGTLVSEYLDHTKVRYEFIHRDQGPNLEDTDIVDRAEGSAGSHLELLRVQPTAPTQSCSF